MGVITDRNYEGSFLDPPHPRPLPRMGEGVAGWKLIINQDGQVIPAQELDMIATKSPGEGTKAWAPERCSSSRVP